METNLIIQNINPLAYRLTSKKKLMNMGVWDWKVRSIPNEHTKLNTRIEDIKKHNAEIKLGL